MALLLSSTALVAASPAWSQSSTAPVTIEEVVVTAQKRSENLQNVPISIQAYDTKKLVQHNVSDFEDIAKLLPSVSYQSLGPGQTNVYMRGVATGGDGLLVGSLPSVGIYLDEQPVTTIMGALDVHIYDIERFEALAGPQGTLFGASSEAGTLRIITNKPKLSTFEAGYTVQGNHVDHGGNGYVAEGFVNQPVGDRAAIRLVGFYQHDAGYIDNVYGERTFPTAGITQNNADLVKKDFNDSNTYGGRAAAVLELDDSWTVTPTVMAQEQKTNGIFAYNPSVGDLEVHRFEPDNSRDRWVQAALTVQGKIANFDVTYAGAYMKRRTQTVSDYSDYSYFYDALYGYYLTNDAGELINPSQTVVSDTHYTKQSHEIRVQSPTTSRLRAVAGLFYQRQTAQYQGQYEVDGLATASSVTGQPGVLYLNQQHRVDRDYAAFGELTYDLTKQLTLTAGGRLFRYDNTVDGFFGFNSTEALCFAPSSDLSKMPCVNIDQRAKRGGHTYKLNATYKFTPDKLIYGTISTGFRPGGINRRASLPPYSPDFLTNYEIGWKTSWFDRRLRFNGALYRLKWRDVQFAFQGANGITDIANAGDARVLGVESDLTWLVMEGLTISGSGAYTDAKLTTNYCAFQSASLDCSLPGPNGEENSILAPAGSRLPVTPKFKGTVTARYEWYVNDFKAHAQGSVAYQSSSPSELRTVEREILGDQAAFTLVDFSFGVEKGGRSVELFLKNAFDKRADLYRYTTCAATACGGLPYNAVNQPRTVGIELSQHF